MNIRLGTTTFCLCLTFCSWAVAQPASPDQAANPAMAELIRKLGSTSFVQRERARKELETLGLSALESLRRARNTSDFETKRRIDDLIRHGEEMLQAQQVLAPREIHLLLKDATLDQALAMLSKTSSYNIQFQGDRTPFNDMKFTLDTGKTTFWQALDQFCDMAGLSEKIDLPANIMPTQPTFRGRGRLNQVYRNVPQTAPSPVVLTNRSTEKSWTSYAGAVKSQLRIGRDARTKELLLDFVLSVEPRLLNSALSGRPVIASARDEHQQKLTALLDDTREDALSGQAVSKSGASAVGTIMAAHGSRRHTCIRIKEGAQAAKLLKQLDGKLTLQCDLTQEVVARVDKVLDAAGLTAPGVNGGSLKVNSIRQAGDDIEIRVTMENLTPNLYGGNLLMNGGNVIIQGNLVVQNMVVGPGGVRIQGAENRKDVPELIDAQGKKFRIVNVSVDSTHFVNNSWSRSATILYRPNQDQALPRELVFLGTRTFTVALPFHFENVMLP